MLAAGIGRIVVDNFDELAMLAELVAGEQPASGSQLPASSSSRFQSLSGSASHPASQPTPMPTSRPATWTPSSASRSSRATPTPQVSLAMEIPGLELVGLHCHIGSQIYEPESLADAAAVLIAFVAEMRDRHGLVLRELSPGGGWGVPMTRTIPRRWSRTSLL